MLLKSFCGVLSLKAGIVILAFVLIEIALVILVTNLHLMRHFSQCLNFVCVFVVVMLFTGVAMILTVRREDEMLCLIAFYSVVLVLLLFSVGSGLSFINLPSTTALVCVEGRCPETLWLAPLRYRKLINVNITGTTDTVDNQKPVNTGLAEHADTKSRGRVGRERRDGSPKDGGKEVADTLRRGKVVEESRDDSTGDPEEEMADTLRRGKVVEESRDDSTGDPEEEMTSKLRRGKVVEESRDDSTGDPKEDMTDTLGSGKVVEENRDDSTGDPEEEMASRLRRGIVGKENLDDSAEVLKVEMASTLRGERLGKTRRGHYTGNPEEPPASAPPTRPPHTRPPETDLPTEKYHSVNPTETSTGSPPPAEEIVAEIEQGLALIHVSVVLLVIYFAFFVFCALTVISFYHELRITKIKLR